MAGRKWKRAAAFLLAGGMLLSPCQYVFAAEGQAQESASAAESGTLTALDGNGSPAAVSDTVLAMLDAGTVYLDEASGYLLSTADGTRIDPVTGEAIAESEEEPSEEPDGPQSSENPEEQENTDDEETPKDSEVPGEDKDPENYEDTSDTEKPEESGDNGDIEAPEQGEDQSSQEDSENGSASNREALIQGAQIVEAPVIVEDFRFWTVARKYGFAKGDIYIREAMPEKTADLTEASMDKTSALKDFSKLSLSEGLTENKIRADLVQLSEGVRAVGYLRENGLLYILKEEEDGWLYVESGSVRGFVKAEEVYTGEDAQTLLEQYQETAKKRAEDMGQEYTGIENAAPIAEALVMPAENQAYTYLRATVDQTVIEKEYALVNVPELNIREGKGADFETVGTLEEGALCYIIADKADEWIYIESGDVRGFVGSEYLDYGEEVTKQVETAGEDSFSVAEQAVGPEENGALYYTLTSVKSGIPGGEVRQSLIEFASQFIGNPYVWGSTSLTDGADCSGFVQSIYKEYGYELPRVAADQAYSGTQIAVEDAQPGDLVFYADESGDVYHVVIYAGNGETIEAQSSDTGIVRGTLDTADAVWAVRILEDSAYTLSAGNISEVNATSEMYGKSLGTFKLTYYCACEICCDVENGIAAKGTPVVEGRTIAVDPDVIPHGTQVIINGHVFTAEDCGGAIDGNHIDIYVNDHQTALELGTGQAEVYLVK